MSVNATPAFKGPAYEFARNLDLGSRVIGNWGAMHAQSQGTIVEKDPVQGDYRIKWDAGGEVDEGWHKVRCTRSVNGSPIGVWPA
jgi:hypothetical protein